ncbi:VPLPA-CTERM sorting domain-containing protein [Methylobacter sp. S3L5C]|uniref:VPLPA-CTERM sorting domain-containing protein n=1 Tax=Methylobacter sp. S3L5C TaxID=2839024 RepID=UPI001FAE4488|nr:VPLPA-CTERM sorting domain-containing protein [Methylobacter sp. S3L5C]UOA07444.1 VPLPA-CTERM sorting domain-containing protein [Methylobacter sp. S3L5C]
MIKTKLAKAITVAIAGTALSMSASTTFASTTMYNTFTTTVSTATDGWTRTFDNGTTSPGTATGPESQGNKGTIVPWLGTSAGALPLGYTGSSHLNWAVQLTGSGDAATISAADSLAKYGTAAEIDTGGGAWRDNSAPTTGWKHQTDIGLVTSNVAQNITLNLTTLGNLLPSTFSKFGVTVFDGMDTSTANYSHHGSWNNPVIAKPYTANNPFATTGLTNIGYSDNVDGVNGFTFAAEAGHIYSIYLGGVDFSKWNTGVDGYALNIKTTSPVPLPGAVWLFGSALAGFVGLRRRKLAV